MDSPDSTQSSGCSLNPTTLHPSTRTHPHTFGIPKQPLSKSKHFAPPETDELETTSTIQDINFSQAPAACVPEHPIKLDPVLNLYRDPTPQSQFNANAYSAFTRGPPGMLLSPRSKRIPPTCFYGEDAVHSRTSSQLHAELDALYQKLYNGDVPGASGKVPQVASATPGSPTEVISSHLPRPLGSSGGINFYGSPRARLLSSKSTQELERDFADALKLNVEKMPNREASHQGSSILSGGKHVSLKDGNYMSTYGSGSLASSALSGQALRMGSGSSNQLDQLALADRQESVAKLAIRSSRKIEPNASVPTLQSGEVDMVALQVAFEEAVEGALRKFSNPLNSPEHLSECNTGRMNGNRGHSGVQSYGSGKSSASHLDPYMNPHASDKYYYKLCRELKVKTRPSRETFELQRQQLLRELEGPETASVGASVLTAQQEANLKLQDIVLRLRQLKGKLAVANEELVGDLSVPQGLCAEGGSAGNNHNHNGGEPRAQSAASSGREKDSKRQKLERGEGDGGQDQLGLVQYQVMRRLQHIKSMTTNMHFRGIQGEEEEEDDGLGGDWDDHGGFSDTLYEELEELQRRQEAGGQRRCQSQMAYHSSMHGDHVGIPEYQQYEHVQQQGYGQPQQTQRFIEYQQLLEADFAGVQVDPTQHVMPAMMPRLFSPTAADLSIQQPLHMGGRMQPREPAQFGGHPQGYDHHQVPAQYLGDYGGAWGYSEQDDVITHHFDYHPAHHAVPPAYPHMGAGLWTVDDGYAHQEVERRGVFDTTDVVSQEVCPEEVQTDMRERMEVLQKQQKAMSKRKGGAAESQRGSFDGGKGNGGRTHVVPPAICQSLRGKEKQKFGRGLQAKLLPNRRIMGLGRGQKVAPE